MSTYTIKTKVIWNHQQFCFMIVSDDSCNIMFAVPTFKWQQFPFVIFDNLMMIILCVFRHLWYDARSFEIDMGVAKYITSMST